MWKVLKHFFRPMLCLIILSPALLVMACSETEEPLLLEYHFDKGTEGWTGDFVDLPVDYQQDMYELEFAYADCPGSLGMTVKALMISGNNLSDDLFMYIRKQLGPADGLKPNTTYLVRFEVEFATNAPAGAAGIGGSPGEAVIVKVGAAATEPLPIIEDFGGAPYYHLSVDKGHQNDDGVNAVRIGNVAKLHNDDFVTYELKTLDNKNRPLGITTDEEGNLWVFVGTDSGFEGKTTLYYTRIQVTLEKM